MTAPPVDHPIIAELDQTRAALADLVDRCAVLLEGQCPADEWAALSDLVDRHLAARAVTA
jgi:hypothetical protein